MRLALAAALLAPLAAWSQYSGPAFEACRAFAEREQRQGGNPATTVVFANDRHLGLNRHSKKVGSQPVASILYGNGSIVVPHVAATEMQFVCLLADEKRPVFFYWAPRLDGSTLVSCTRGPETRAKSAECIDALLKLVDQDLTQAYARRFQEARDADARAGNQNASNAIRKSNDAWRAYRDAECARRGVGDAYQACLVDLGRQRLRDMQ